MQTIIGNGFPRESNGGVPVNILDQTSNIISPLFTRPLAAPTILAVSSIPDQYTITVSDNTGFIDGADVAIIQEPHLSYFGSEIGAPSGNIITLDTPINAAFTVGAVVIPLSREMAINGTLGSGGRTSFTVGPFTRAVELTRTVGVINSATEPDNSLFGNLDPLARGFFFRKVTAGGEYINGPNWRANLDIILSTQDGVLYSDKAGGGLFGTTFSMGFAGQENWGVVVRLEIGDYIEALIQDDLSDLELFNQIFHGHYVAD